MLDSTQAYVTREQQTKFPLSLGAQRTIKIKQVQQTARQFRPSNESKETDQ
jgi:hypothetical protein